MPASVAAGGQLRSPRQGFPAPDFTLPTLAGGETTLSAYRGQVVILNFWASWCGPCRAEMPALEQVYAAQRAHGLEVLAVNSTVQDSLAAAHDFAQALGLTFPVPLDHTGTATYLVRGLPSTFVIDRRGVIRAVVFGGPISVATLETLVDDLLQEAP